MAGFFEWYEALKSATELSAADRHVAVAIGLHANVKTGANEYPSITTLADETARKRNTIIESIAWLELAGWLLVTRRRLPGKQARDKSYYTLVVPTERKTKAERDAWAKLRASTRTGTRVVPKEVPASEPSERVELVPEEDRPGTPLGTNLVPEGIPELPLTSPMNLKSASTTASTQRAEEDIGERFEEAWCWP